MARITPAHCWTRLLVTATVLVYSNNADYTVLGSYAEHAAHAPRTAHTRRGHRGSYAGHDHPHTDFPACG